jgi:hypothetical protein
MEGKDIDRWQESWKRPRLIYRLWCYWWWWWWLKALIFVKCSVSSLSGKRIIFFL